jgi:methyl-accepting chemotaxis protein
MTLRIGARDAILSSDPADAQKTIDQLPKLSADFDAAVTAYVATGMTPDRQAIVDELKTTEAAYRDMQKKVLAPLAVAGDMRGWVAANDAHGPALTDVLLADSQKLIDTEDREGRAAIADIRSSAASETTSSIIIMVVALLVAVGVGLVVATGIARAARKVQDVTDALAKGDLTRSSGLAT